MYVTASKDGSVRVWDGVTAQCVRPILGAHGSMEATSASFTKDQRYRVHSRIGNFPVFLVVLLICCCHEVYVSVSFLDTGG